MMGNYSRGLGMMGGFRIGGGIFMVLVGLAFLALVVLAIVALIRYIGKTTVPAGIKTVAAPALSPAVDKAIEIANERFARGEITVEEFTAIKTELRKQ